MRNYREAARLIREAAELLDERGKTMAISKKGAKPFPITKGEIDAINNALHEWTVEAKKRVAPLWKRDYKNTELYEELRYNSYVDRVPINVDAWIDNEPASLHLLWYEYVYEEEKDNDSGIKCKGEVYISIPDSDGENRITLGWIHEALYYNGNYSLEYVPYKWSDIVEQLEELGYEE